MVQSIVVERNRCLERDYSTSLEGNTASDLISPETGSVKKLPTDNLSVVVPFYNEAENVRFVYDLLGVAWLLNRKITPAAVETKL